MVLGLIDFILGGKKKTKLPKTGQVTVPTQSTGFTPSAQTAQAQVQAAANPAQNTQVPTTSAPLEFKSSSPSQEIASSVPKSSLNEVLSKMYTELKTANERVTDLVTDVKKIETTVNGLGHKVDDLEGSNKLTEEKLADINVNMGKFLSLYELINNQYNPFVEQIVAKPQVLIDANGNTSSQSLPSSSSPSFTDVRQIIVPTNPQDDIESALLALDTLNIEQAAADAVPLTHLKNNTNSLVIILSWLEYLNKRVGVDQTRDTLRYYTEVLRWITPEVYFDLDKYLKGMRDKKDSKSEALLTVKDHIVSLYFISKLNEKVLDEKLTKAVLQIIKQ